MQNDRFRRLSWIVTALIAVTFILFLSRRPTALSTLLPEEEIAAAFWKAEAGEALSPAERHRIASLVSQIPDTAPAAYGLAVTYLLLYGTDALNAAPMIYIQRLQQMRNIPTVLAYLGRLAYHTGQVEKAQTYLREALQADPTCGTAYLFLARIESDSTCVWLARGGQATYTRAEQTFLVRLRERSGCS